jgi:phosphosulfolactate synthase (CoM biosynthesis protein A)
LLSPFVDTVKIYDALPLLVPERVLKKRIKFYHDFDVQVSTSSTIAEFAILENSIPSIAKKAAELGFDTLELGENKIDLLPEDKKKIVEIIASQDLHFQWKVGKRSSPPTWHRGNLNKNRLGHCIRIKKIVLEAN